MIKYSLYSAVIPITTGIAQRNRRTPSYRCKRDRELDVRRQLSADARAFHFSGSSSSSADGEDADGDSLPYRRKSLGERLYPRVHALQPVSSLVYSFKMLENYAVCKSSQTLQLKTLPALDSGFCNMKLRQ